MKMCLLMSVRHHNIYMNENFRCSFTSGVCWSGACLQSSVTQKDDTSVSLAEGGFGAVTMATDPSRRLRVI